MFSETYRGKKVLVTGCRGFKGSWLVQWLQMMGAQVSGIGLPPRTIPNHYTLLAPTYPDRLNLCEWDKTLDFFREQQPDLVFHLAAHAIVAEGFEEPRGFIENNVMAGLNVLEACRQTRSVKGIVFVTSDKVYKDMEWDWGYRESDMLGGPDPYSSSKVCLEHLAHCYDQSFSVNVAVARAGNVIGGGDWNRGRLIPDLVRGAVSGEPVIIKSPRATRPWQHVLDALQGYLLLGKEIIDGINTSTAWNFGPTEERTVIEVANIARGIWKNIEVSIQEQEVHPNPVHLLKIDSSRARNHLGWKPKLPFELAIEYAIRWYRALYEQGYIATKEQIERYGGGR